MEHVTRTVYGSYLQTCLKLKIPHIVLPFTTLNEKLGIQSGVVPPPGVYPTVGYYVWGNKGHQGQIGADGIPLVIAAQHRATDAALFNQLPFVLRPVSNDLTPVERAKYGLRREEVHNGVTHAAYRLKRIDKTSIVAEMQYRSNTNGTITVTPFVPTADNLNPTPVVIPEGGVTTLTGDYVIVSAQTDISLSAWEVAEMRNVAEIIYGDPNYAIISEIGVCSGVDKVITVTPSVGTAFNFNEVIAVQITTHIAVMNVLTSSNEGVTRILDFGTNDPLFNIA
jgi:hypothetical protein